jgi:hypothetical protein
MDGALGVAIVAAVFAGLAVVFTAWGAWASHRSARASESSARSADISACSAAEAVELERDRRHRELTPRILLKYQGPTGSGEDAIPEGVEIANGGPLDYSSVYFSFAGFPADGPIARSVHDGTEGELGSLDIGEHTFLELERHSEDHKEHGDTLYLAFTCSNDRGTWTIPAQVEIPRKPWFGVAVH